MQELLIVNPAKRPTKRRKTRKAASPAQKRARAAFAARARARSTNPAKRRARRVARPRTTGVTIMSNPRKRRSTKRAVTRSSRRRRNPISLGRVKPMSLLTPALMGAIGAATVNTILGKLPLPAAATTGNMKYVTQAAAAMALAVIGTKIGGKSALFAQMAEGSLTVTLHQALVEIAGSAGMNLSGVNGMGYYLPGRQAAMPSRGANPAQLAGMSRYMTGPGAGAGTPGLATTIRRNANGMRGFSFAR